MDLKNLTPTSDTVDVTIVHPTTLEPLTNDDKSEMTITMYAPHSKEYKGILHHQTNKRLKQAQGKKKVDITAESIEEATIINWLKNEGDEIYIDDLVVEIATDKVDSEVPSDVSGILIKKLCKVNDVVKVGEPIAVIEIENSLEASSETKPVLKSEKPENEVQKIN